MILTVCLQQPRCSALSLRKYCVEVPSSRFVASHATPSRQTWQAIRADNRQNVDRCSPIAAAAPGNSQPASDDEDEVLFEEQLKARRNRNRRTQQRPGPADGSSSAKPKQAVPLAGSETETLILQSLAAYFCIILLQGVALAVSGFLPETADRFIVDYIYPSFSYQMGIFFTCSTVYGLWKTSSTK